SALFARRGDCRPNLCGLPLAFHEPGQTEDKSTALCSKLSEPRGGPWCYACGPAFWVEQHLRLGASDARRNSRIMSSSTDNPLRPDATIIRYHPCHSHQSLGLSRLGLTGGPVFVFICAHINRGFLGCSSIRTMGNLDWLETQSSADLFLRNDRRP